MDSSQRWASIRIRRILAEAVKELKENEFKELYDTQDKNKGSDFVDEVQIDTDMAVHIPDNYVNNIEERLKLYQRLGAIETRGRFTVLRIRTRG